MYILESIIEIYYIIEIYVSIIYIYLHLCNALLQNTILLCVNVRTIKTKCEIKKKKRNLYSTHYATFSIYCDARWTVGAAFLERAGGATKVFFSENILPITVCKSECHVEFRERQATTSEKRKGKRRKRGECGERKACEEAN